MDNDDSVLTNEKDALKRCRIEFEMKEQAIFFFFFIAINHFYYYYNIQKADTCIKEKMTWRKNIVSIMKKIINYEISDLVIRKNSKSSYGLEETPLNNVFKLSCPVSLRVQQGL